MNGRTPARLYSLLAGGALVTLGVIGFFYSADFGNPGTVRDAFGALSVNGWHNFLHIATGALGLLALGYSARMYAGGAGLALLVLAVWGFAIGGHDTILGVIPVNAGDDALHAVLGLAGLAAYVATPAEPATTPGAAGAAS
jgi:hypothetical protein